MSYRERRNRKDACGKTPEQIQRGYRRHELTYAQAIEGLHESDLPLNPAGYFRGIGLMFDHFDVSRET